jgi:hypothetical protein
VFDALVVGAVVPKLNADTPVVNGYFVTPVSAIIDNVAAVTVLADVIADVSNVNANIAAVPLAVLEIAVPAVSLIPPAATG